MTGAAFEEYRRVRAAYGANEATWEDVVAAWNECGHVSGEPSGVPMPIKGIPLYMAPRHQFREMLDGETRETLDYRARRDKRKGKRYLSASKFLKELTRRVGGKFARLRKKTDIKVLNSWYSHTYQRVCQIQRDMGTGKLSGVVDGEAGWQDRANLLLRTRKASFAWSVLAELTALQKLERHISSDQLSEYILTGSFTVHSKRSNLTYLIRKSRPTVVFNCKNRILACLCLHPVGFYAGTFAGAMVPTDDVIAHLMYIRSDERKFWAKANQHPPWSCTSGI